jgi:hypothetical protein
MSSYSCPRFSHTLLLIVQPLLLAVQLLLLAVQSLLLTVELLLLVIGGLHIGARALLDINVIWFGYIARLSRGGGGILLVQVISRYLPLFRLEGGGGSAPSGLHLEIIV